MFGIADDVTWVTGAHTLKLGGELRRDRIKASYIFDPNGDYTFNGQYSGSAAADFLLGFPSIFRQAVGDPNLDGASWTYAIYGQDELRLGSRVTLNYGLRHELCPPFIEAHDRLNAFHPGQQSRMFPTAPTGLVYPGDAGVPRGTYHADVNNVAPRVAAIWNPRGNGRTSVRAAWGLFYDALPGQGDFFQNGVIAPPFHTVTEVSFPLQTTSAHFANPLEGIANAVRGPGFTRTDVSLFKRILIARWHESQLRVEAFNVLNSARFNQPGNQIGSPTLGQITSADDGRIVQLGIKYAF